MIKEKIVKFDFSFISYHTYCGEAIISKHPVVCKPTSVYTLAFNIIASDLTNIREALGSALDFEN